MDIYNNSVTRRLNLQIRKRIVAPAKAKKLKKKDFSILCNNCTGGFILHDLGQRFDSPTVNMFFRGLDFFDFVEHFDYYIGQPLVEIPNPRLDPAAPDYPVAVLRGDGKLKDLELHFMHYPSFEEANAKWETRKSRLHRDSLYVIWTFMGMEKDEELYRRAEGLPVKNKVFFVNHPVDAAQYPHFFYIKGYENQKGLGQLSAFTNLFGKRYYDQFDYVGWINNG